MSIIPPVSSVTLGATPYNLHLLSPPQIWVKWFNNGFAGFFSLFEFSVQLYVFQVYFHQCTMDHIILFRPHCKITKYFHAVYNKTCLLCIFLLVHDSKLIPDHFLLTLAFRNPRDKFRSNVQNWSLCFRTKILQEDRVRDREEQQLYRFAGQRRLPRAMAFKNCKQVQRKGLGSLQGKTGSSQLPPELCLCCQPPELCSFQEGSWGGLQKRGRRLLSLKSRLAKALMEPF